MTADIPPFRDVVVVGGGLAGLAAATRLSAAGREVLLLESRPRLGGRATSFEDKTTGDLVDNCQHVGMGCCHQLQEFCLDVGIDHQFRVERQLTFIDANGQQSNFYASRWPAPFHLTGALFRLKHFSAAEKLEIALGLGRLVRERRYDGPFERWLIFVGQSERVRQLFWHVVVVSALSDSLANVATQVARKVFVEGFLRNRTAWEVHIPDTALDDLYGSPVVKTLADRRAMVRTNAAVARIDTTDSSAIVTLRSGEAISCKACVVAVPHHRIAGLLDNEQGLYSTHIAAAESLTPAPIASVHLWFDRQITTLPHAVFVEHLCQWLFPRPTTRPGTYYYQVVISASHDLAKHTQDEIINQVGNELSAAFEAAVDAKLVHARVVTEKRAVFSPTPSSQQLRPSQTTDSPHLFVAGDWTATGWPATMEGAVRSGYLAADALLTGRCPTPASLDDQPADRLPKLLGLS